MKYIIFSLAAISLAVISAGCSKDHGNYDYADKEKITITGLEASYTVVSQLDRLQITPQVSSTDPDASFEYNWGIVEASYALNALPAVDTIARTKDLDYLVTKEAKMWRLIYRITNKHTGFATYFTSLVSVGTEFTRGWYVAKDDGLNADMDLFQTPGSILPGDMSENIYSAVNGAKLKGQARFLSFLSGYKVLDPGTGGAVQTRSLFMSATEDLAVVNINNLKNIRTLDNLFYVAPEVKRPGQVFNGNISYHMLNDGQLHSIWNATFNDGRFGARVLKDGVNSPYHLSDYFMIGVFNDPYFFDELSSSFIAMTMGLSTTGFMMTAVKDQAGTEMPANNMNKNLLYLGTKSATSYSTMTGVAVFQDKDDPSLRILSIITAPHTTKQIKIMNDTLTTSDKLYHATAYTVLNGDENILYFAVGNEIWSRNLSNQFEKLEYTIPAGEELTYIRHKKYSAEADYAYNFIIIGTKAGARYKVRMFEKASGSIVSAQPKVMLEGNGIARDVYYISPSVSETTQYLTY